MARPLAETVEAGWAEALASVAEDVAAMGDFLRAERHSRDTGRLSRSGCADMTATSGPERSRNDRGRIDTPSPRAASSRCP